ncbi:MAG: hypothetical protein II278_07985, partial [Bacteroidaceae bacterium]|nr:hypothetical protein [Bacteroidaceae bacterium]
DYTAAQIAKHEAGHDMIARGEVDINAVRERCKDVAPNGNVEELSAMYTKAYDGIGMTVSRIETSSPYCLSRPNWDAPLIMIKPHGAS